MATIRDQAKGRLAKAGEYYAKNPKELKAAGFGPMTRAKLDISKASKPMGAGPGSDAKNVKIREKYEDSIPEAMTPRKRK